MQDLIDISQTLQSGMDVWPGDTPFQTFWMMRMEDGEPCNVGSVTMSLHTGTHADAPKHFRNDGRTPGDCDLSAYAGPVHVVDASASPVVTSDVVRSIAEVKPERVLFKTAPPAAPQTGPSPGFIDPDAAAALVALGVRLVGLDTPSVDQSDSTLLPTHNTLAKANIAILENLDLGHVEPGLYELFAFPLKLRGMDASPVRAVLRRM